MITDSLLNIFVDFVNSLIDMLPTVAYNLPPGILDTSEMLFSNIGYVMPMSGLMPLFVFLIALNNFKLILAIIVRIKSFIPTMGS